MKRLSALLLLFCLLMSVCACAEGGEAVLPVYSTEYFEQKPGFYRVSVQENGTFIDASPYYGAAEKSFVHAYESDDYYSYVYTDILVVTSAEEPYPVLRTWVIYHGTQPIHAGSVTFVLDGASYTFSNVGAENRRTETDSDYKESLLIRYGSSNTEFIAAIRRVGAEIAAHMNEKGYVYPTYTLILHGAEDLTVALDGRCIADAYLMMGGFVESGGPAYLDKAVSTRLTVKQGVK